MPGWAGVVGQITFAFIECDRDQSPIIRSFDPSSVDWIAETTPVLSGRRSDLRAWPKGVRRESPLDSAEQNKNKNKQATTSPQGIYMVRLARESLALASVASFVWMMLAVVTHVA